MKIANAECILLSMPFESGGTPPWSFGGKPANNFDILLVRVETESGLIGWGEAFSRNRDMALKAAIETRVLPLIIGKDVTKIVKIKHDLEFQLHNFGRIGPIIYGISAVDIALWDIMGKACNAPLSQLLGGSMTSDLEVYASLMRYGGIREVETATHKAAAQGYRFIKLHEVDMEVIRAAVAAAGPDVRIMLDTNCPWSVAEATHYSRELSDLNLFWLEEPVWPPENYSGLADIRRLGIHRIASGENAGSLFDFVAMIRENAVDIAQPDVAKTGGITEVMKIGALCEAHGVEFVPHCAIFGPGQVATVHLNAAYRSTPMLERLFCEFETELWGEKMTPVHGKVAVPNGPGLGLEPDPDVIRSFRI